MNYKIIMLSAIIGAMQCAWGMEPLSKKVKISRNGFEYLSEVMRSIGDAGISEHDTAFALMWKKYDTFTVAINKNRNPFLTSKFDAEAFELAKEFECILNTKYSATQKC